MYVHICVCAVCVCVSMRVCLSRCLCLSSERHMAGACECGACECAGCPGAPHIYCVGVAVCRGVLQSEWYAVS